MPRPPPGRKQFRLNATVMLRAAPVVALGKETKWGSEKIGPVAWFIMAALVLGGIWLYPQQPGERRERIRDAAAKTGMFLLEEASKAAAEVGQARVQLTAKQCPGPRIGPRSPS
jgi:hypothetical protein